MPCRACIRYQFNSTCPKEFGVFNCGCATQVGIAKKAPTPGSAPLRPGAMELISRRSDGFQTGTAGDHWALARAHTWHALRLQICGPTKSSTAVTPVVKPAEMLDGSKEAVEPSSCVILPSYAWKESWDLAILMAILYSAVTVPYRICFSATTEPGTNMYLFEQTVTVLFITDVLLNFNTAYMEDGVWVTHRGAIARTYLSGWFWIDFPSSVPVELIDFVAVALEGAFEASGADEEEGGASHYAFLRFLRLFRLLRLMRLLKLNEYISTMGARTAVECLAAGWSAPPMMWLRCIAGHSASCASSPDRLSPLVPRCLRSPRGANTFTFTQRSDSTST